MATSPDDVTVSSRFPFETNTTMGETPARQLDFYQAMADFRQMFPDLEEDVIEAVLRANNGAVDATIDQLLTMNVDAGSSANSSINSSLKGPSADSFHEHSESYPYHITDSSSDEEDGKNHPPPYSPPCYNEYANLSDMSSPRSPGRGDQSTTSSVRSDCLASSANTTDLLMALGGHSMTHSLPASQSYGLGAMSGSSMSDTVSDKPSLKQPPSLLDDDFMPSTLPPKMSLLDHDYTVRQKASAAALTALSPGAAAISPPPASISPSLGATAAAPLGATPPEKSVFCDKHRSYTGKRVYHNWNPPMLGSLPDDFLRITLTPPSSTSSSPRHQAPQVAKVTPSHTPTHTPRPLSSPARSLSSPSWSPSRSRSPRSDSKSEKLRHLPSRTLSLTAHGSDELSLIKQRLVENEEAMARARSKSVDQETQQMLADEHLALALQNEEFLKVLKDDKDFMDKLERDRMNATAFEPTTTKSEPRPANQLNAAFDPDLQSPDLDPNRPPKEQLEGYGEDQLGELGPFPFSADLHPDDDAEFRRQLKLMGGSSKKRFMTLAKKFFTRTKKKSKPKHSYKEAGAPSTTGLLDEEEDDLHHYHRHQHNNDDMNGDTNGDLSWPDFPFQAKQESQQSLPRLSNGV